ncbi:MAG: TetR/AcrR family transcriptional regulator [Acidimicrobiales bacterium]
MHNIRVKHEEGTAAHETAPALRKDALENRSRILEAAKELFAEYGLKVTMDDIARRSGVGVGTVYRRFPTKELLVEALFEERIEQLVGIARTAAEAEDPWAGFVYLFEAFLAQESEDKGFRQVVLGTHYESERMAKLKSCLTPLLSTIIDRAKKDGQLRDDFYAQDIPALTAMIGVSEEFCHVVRSGMWRRYFTIILDGLHAGPSVRTPLPAPSLDECELKEAMSHWRGTNSLGHRGPGSGVIPQER